MSATTSIESKRLNIRSWVEKDAAAFFELTKDDGFNAFPITVYRQPGIEAAREWIRREIELYKKTGLGKVGIWSKENDVLIGMGGLTPWEWEGEKLVDLTYRIRQSAWGKGYGSEAAVALTEYAFGPLHLKEITATITPDNAASIKIARRLGMELNKRIILKSVETDLYLLPKNKYRIEAVCHQ